MNRLFRPGSDRAECEVLSCWNRSTVIAFIKSSQKMVLRSSVNHISSTLNEHPSKVLSSVFVVQRTEHVIKIPEEIDVKPWILNFCMICIYLKVRIIAQNHFFRSLGLWLFYVLVTEIELATQIAYFDHIVVNGCEFGIA